MPIANWKGWWLKNLEGRFGCCHQHQDNRLRSRFTWRTSWGRFAWRTFWRWLHLEGEESIEDWDDEDHLEVEEGSLKVGHTCFPIGGYHLTQRGKIGKRNPAPKMRSWQHWDDLWKPVPSWVTSKPPSSPGPLTSHRLFLGKWVEIKKMGLQRIWFLGNDESGAAPANGFDSGSWPAGSATAPIPWKFFWQLHHLYIFRRLVLMRRGWYLWGWYWDVGWRWWHLLPVGKWVQSLSQLLPICMLEH